MLNCLYANVREQGNKEDKYRIRDLAVGRHSLPRVPESMRFQISGHIVLILIPGF